MEIPRHRMIMILGDMNARVGRAKDSWPGIIGGYGSPKDPPPLPSPLCRAAAGSGGGGGAQGFWGMAPEALGVAAAATMAAAAATAARERPHLLQVEGKVTWPTTTA